MILIPGGTTTVGLAPEQQESLVAEHQAPAHFLKSLQVQELQVASFYIDRTEVTNRQYRAFIEATGYRLPIAWVDRGFPEGLEDHPVSGVDFDDAQAFCRWAGKRLPTEIEWEKAARGAEAHLWPWGTSWQPGACRMDDGGPGPLQASTVPVGSFPRDISGYGVVDMAGNVSEWVGGDLEEPYGYTAMTRGGNFTLSQPHRFLSSCHVSQPKGNGSIDYVGFRCAKDADNAARNDAAPATLNGQQPVDHLTELQMPDPALYRTRPITFSAITDLVPNGNYQNQMMVYLPRRHEETAQPGKTQPWRIEINVPYLPGDRFSCLFEQYWNGKMQLVSRTFNDDRTAVELIAEKQGEVSVKLSIHGGLDYVDLDYLVKNHSPHDMHSATETCFVSLAAPNFRDHQGTRTFVMTAEGFTPIAEIRRPVIPRWLIGDFLFGPNAQARPMDEPPVTGPLIAIVSRDRQWLVAPVSMSGPPARLVNNREYSCIHSNPPSAVKAGQEMAIRERIYFLRGSLKDLAARWNSDIADGNR